VLQAADELESGLNHTPESQLYNVVANHIRLIRTVSEFARMKELYHDANRGCVVCGKGNGGRGRRGGQRGV
jgi:hypothetical protein